MDVNTGDFVIDIASRVDAVVGQADDRRRPAVLGGRPIATSAPIDDRDGKVLWQTRVQDIPNAFPITYMVDGKQYIAMVAGNPGLVGNGAGRASAEYQRPSPTSVLWVWQLPDAN